MALLWQVIITVCFWGFIVPTGNFIEYTGTTNHIIKYSMDHSVPFILLCVEWCLNSIGFEYSQILINLAVFLVYGVINYFYVTISGEIIYPILTWDSLGSYLAALGLIPAIAIINLLLILCTNYKISKIDKNKWD
jgi:hypothetical protein